MGKIVHHSVDSDLVGYGKIKPDLEDVRSQLADKASQTEVSNIKVSIISKGGNPDGVTDNLTAFNDAKTAAGAKGIVYFPQNSTGNAKYYFLTAPNLDNVTIDAAPGVILSFPTSNSVSFGLTKLLSDISIESRDRNNTGFHPRNVLADWITPLVVGDLFANEGIQNPNVLDATTFESKKYNTTSDTISAGIATLTSSRQVDWAQNAIGSTSAGIIDVVQTPVKVGKEYLASFKAPVFNNTSVRGGILINAGGEWALFSVDASNHWFLGVKKQGVAWSENTWSAAAPEIASNAYMIYNNIQPIISARIVSLTEVEFYINGLFVKKYTTSGGYVQTVGFGYNGASNSLGAQTIYNFIEADVPRRARGDVLNLAYFGDSITYGEGVVIPHPNLIKYALLGMNGISDVAITNYAVSGQKASQQLSILQTTSVSAFDYVLMMVGTNDIQSQTAYDTYRQNLLDMIAKVKADGSIPIIGVPPMFIDATTTGYGFATANYTAGGVYRSIVYRVAAEQGVQVADVLTDFGKIGKFNKQLRDNIHPNSFYMSFIAKSFARAVLALETGKQVNIQTGLRREGSNTVAWLSAMPTSGSWVKGDIVYNTNVSVLGSAGSQYTLLGWRRLTNGYTNVLNTDWVEMRQLTGS